MEDIDFWKRTYLLPVLFTAVVMVGGTAFYTITAPEALGDVPADKEFLLIAENFRFNETNPDLVVNQGDVVKITLINRDDVPHDFVIGQFRVAASLEKDREVVVVFRADTAGTFKYTCTIHPGLMDGRLIVRGAATAPSSTGPPGFDRAEPVPTTLSIGFNGLRPSKWR